MTRPGASGSGQKIEERQEEYQAPTHASWPLWQTDKPSSSELLNLWSGKYERLLYRYTQLEKHCNVFFCHLVVRSTIVFYSTSNYRVSEKSISIFPQLGVMVVIVGLKVSSYHWITRILSLIKHRLDLIKAARHRHYVNQLIMNRCQLTVIIYILDYIQFSLK